MKLRLLLFEKCNRRCKWCANKFWDLKSVPTEDRFDKYEKVLLTGGEPMLDPLLVINTAKEIRIQNPEAQILLYTAKTDDWRSILSVLHYVDGLTVTLHNKADIKPFHSLNSIMMGSNMIGKRLKINMFKEFDLNFNLNLWTIKRKRWLKQQHVPKNEVFKQLKKG